MPDVVVSENVSGPAIDALGREFDVDFSPDLWKSADALRERLRTARALIVRNQTQVTAEVLAAAPRLLVVARAGVGVDNIDVAAATAAGTVVAFAPAANAVSVAELAIGLMLSLARHLPQANADTRAGGWNRLHYMGTELAGKTLGLVGFGRIGRLTAARARAFDMRILAADALLTPDAEALVGTGAQLVSVEQLLTEADFVSLHVPLTPATRGLLGAAQLARMKPSAVLVNTSRGEVVDEAALAAALEAGRLRGAALDVREREPPTVGRLERLPNVILTPHVGAFTDEAQRRVVDAVCRDVRAVLDGGAAQEFVNFAAPRK